MRPGYRLQSLGLLLAGFLLGIIVAGLNSGTHLAINGASQTVGDYSDSAGLKALASTEAWDVLVNSDHDGRRIALGQNGQVRVVVQDDVSALYVFTYKQGDPLWQGRLMDVGNDGTIEVADLSFGRCEAFQ